MMPKLQVFSKTKKESYGIQRHDSYNVTIPYQIVQELNLQDGMLLHSTASEKSGTIRLHTKQLRQHHSQNTPETNQEIQESEILFHKSYNPNWFCKIASA